MILKGGSRLRRILLMPFRNISDQKLRDNYDLSNDEISRILGQTELVRTKEKIPAVINKETQIRELKYDLPIINEPFPVVYDEDETRKFVETPNQNLYEVLQLTEASSYQDYEKALVDKLHNQLDMYGDEQAPPTVGQLEFLPLLQHNSPYLVQVRQKHYINMNLPGTVEIENPNNFLELRPIEEFRHTPLIPISQAAMRKHKQMLAQYHRKAFVFEIKTESVLNFLAFAVAAGICGYLIHQVIKKEEETAISYQRLRLQRILGEDRQGSLV